MSLCACLLLLSGGFLVCAKNKRVRDSVLFPEPAPTEEQAPNGAISDDRDDNLPGNNGDDQDKIFMRYTDENLVDIINTIAERKGVNVILPVNNPITSKVTVSFEHGMSVDQAWNFLYQLLDIAGYSMVPRSRAYAIVKNVGDMTRESVPLFIDVPYNQLPQDDQRIRCLFYLKNIKVPGDQPGPDRDNNELVGVLKYLLPNGAGSGIDVQAKFQFDQVTNALIITERASIIRSIMEIVEALDTTGFKERVEIVELFNTVAQDVKNIFDDIMKTNTSPMNMYRLDSRKQSAEATYFSKFVRIFPYNRLNTLIVLGREQAVDRVCDFIRKHIDTPPDAGETVFHVYRLQYLDAAELTPILQRIVGQNQQGGPSQSTGEAPKIGGPERFFEGVKIISDLPAGQDGGSMGQQPGAEATKGQPIYYGGNKLVIAARHDDWIRIKKLLEEIDKPQPQVIIEVLIADLTLDDARLIGSMIRTPLNIPLIRDVQFQSAQLDQPIVNNLNTPNTVALYPPNIANDVDMLRDVYDASGVNRLTTELSPIGSGTSIPGTFPAGATAVSFMDERDPQHKAWGIGEIYNIITNRKVLSCPHVIAANNQQTKIIVGEARLVRDATIGGMGNVVTVPYKPISANMEINIKPRICYSPDDDPRNDTVQMGIVVEISDFIDPVFNPDYSPANLAASSNPSAANTLNRTVITSALVRNQEVLPLGGLLQRTATDDGSETPILGRIPIIGWFFKKRHADMAETNLTVFIRPTVIRPRLRRGGMDLYTRDYLKLTKRYSEEGDLFDSLRDPVTHWFFRTDSDARLAADQILETDGIKQDKELLAAPGRKPKKTYSQRLEEMDKKEALKKAAKREPIEDDHEERLKNLIKDESNPLKEIPIKKDSVKDLENRSDPDLILGTKTVVSTPRTAAL